MEASSQSETARRPRQGSQARPTLLHRIFILYRIVLYYVILALDLLRNARCMPCPSHHGCQAVSPPGRGPGK
jgi:hypothetical protein